VLFSRRALLASAVLSPLMGADSRYRVGITSNTRGGWEKDVFLSFRESREVGYRYVESFIHYFVDYWDRPADLQKRLDEIGVRFVTISNGNPMEMGFQDPARHEKLIADHVRLARFIKALGCEHLKINLGSRRPDGTTAEDLRHMSSGSE
jgi:sugar phosphate isomerase/epimerase